MVEISVRTFLDHVREPIGLELVAGEAGLDRVLSSARIQKPGLALAGYTAFVHGDRVQILGETELSYLETLDQDARLRAIEGFLDLGLACIVITKGLPIPPALVEGCEKVATPLFSTSMTSSIAVRRILTYLDDLLSPRCTKHGVLIDVNGVGVLITGKSGIGKSECALDLVSRGYRLVADDIVEIRRRGEDLVGQASALIQSLIEVRGLGIINVAELFGVLATREHKRIELHVELEAWSPDVHYDRTGLDQRTEDILGVGVRSLLIPVQPGRNVANIVEVAARNLLLQERGHNAPNELNRRIAQALDIEGSGPQSPVLSTAARIFDATDHLEDEVE